MKWIINIIVFLSLICERDCASPQDVAECGRKHFAEIVCTSVNFFYRECLVENAEQITDIKLHAKMSTYGCDFKESFGFRKNNVWVTDGCSGKFYLCYNGDPQPGKTTRKNTDVPFTVAPPSRGTPQDTTTAGEVMIGSTSAADTNILIYVIVASCVVLLVGIGLIVGCVVKRRQQNDKSRHLAAKRQIRIELKEHREHMEENGVAMLPLTPSSFPLATRSLSVESINYGESVNYNQGYKTGSENEGSIDSYQSSVSGMTSASAMTTGHMYRSRPSWDGSSSGQPNIGILKKGLSTSDISMLGRMYCDANSMSRQSKSSLVRHSRSSLVRCSQSSLESVREVCNKYQVFNIPLERKLEKQVRIHSPTSTVGYSSDQNRTSKMVRKPKYNTLGHSRGIADSISDKNQMKLKAVGRSSMNIKTTKALVHRSPSIRSNSVQSVSSVSSNVPMPTELPGIERSIREHKPVIASPSIPSNAVTKVDNVKPRDHHYHDPTSLIMQSKAPPTVKHVTLLPIRPVSPAVHTSKPEIIYGTVNKQKMKPKILPKPTNTIYATVNKSYIKAASRVSDKTCFEYDVKALEDDEEDVSVPEVTSRDNQYARLDTFGSQSMYTYPVPIVRVPELSSAVTNC